VTIRANLRFHSTELAHLEEFLSCIIQLSALLLLDGFIGQCTGSCGATGSVQTLVSCVHCHGIVEEVVLDLFNFSLVSIIGVHNFLDRCGRFVGHSEEKFIIEVVVDSIRRFFLVVIDDDRGPHTDVNRLAHSVLALASCNAVPGCNLIQNFEIFVISSSLLMLMSYPVRSHYKQDSVSKYHVLVLSLTSFSADCVSGAKQAEGVVVSWQGSSRWLSFADIILDKEDVLGPSFVHFNNYK